MMVNLVQYTVKAEYAARNQENIRRVTKELRALQRTDLKYSVFVGEDGKSFNHLLICENEEARKVFVELGAFKAFQAQLMESGPEVSPKANKLSLVGSSAELI